MTRCIGRHVVACLERAGDRHLKEQQPDIHQQFLLQVGGTDALHCYDHSAAYWHQVQAILDCFFTSMQRVEVLGWLLAESELDRRPEFLWFKRQALAERRVQQLLAGLGRGQIEARPAQPA